MIEILICFLSRCGGEARFDLWQRGEDDVADRLQAAGGDRVERVLCGMTAGKVEIDEIDRRHILR